MLDKEEGGGSVEALHSMGPDKTFPAYAVTHLQQVQSLQIGDRILLTRLEDNARPKTTLTRKTRETVVSVSIVPAISKFRKLLDCSA